MFRLITLRHSLEAPLLTSGTPATRCCENVPKETGNGTIKAMKKVEIVPATAPQTLLGNPVFNQRNNGHKRLVGGWKGEKERGRERVIGDAWVRKNKNNKPPNT